MGNSSLLDRVERLWGHPIRRLLPNRAAALEAWLLQRWERLPSEATLRRELSPQWVVLAAGAGSRIDPSGRFNKLLDIWLGDRNVLQLSVAHLPTDRPPILVINPMMARRLLRAGLSDPLTDRSGALSNQELDPERVARWLVPGAQVVVQPVPNGTGGALKAAAPLLAHSDAELLGVAFGDEPFLEPEIYLETLIAHLLHGADGTLCGKRPEAVAAKGGLFFDAAGRFVGTKEWYDMTPQEQREMEVKLQRGEAITNTGISLFRREAALERLDRLWLHKGGTEYHHVDLFRLLYEDGLRTHAHVYEREIPSGVNRWRNVVLGEAEAYRRTAERLQEAGGWVHPAASVLWWPPRFGEETSPVAAGVRLRGRVVLGQSARVEAFSLVEDSQLLGRTRIGGRAAVRGSWLLDVRVESYDDGAPIGGPGDELIATTEVVDSELWETLVGGGARLVRVRGERAVVPPGLEVRDRRLGMRRDPTLGLRRWPPALWEVASSDYLPGAFTFGEKRGTDEWDRLLNHIRRMAFEELGPRAYFAPEDRRRWEWATEAILGEAVFSLDAWTPEELWGLLLEVLELIRGEGWDPYRREKRLARRWAFRLLEQHAPAPEDWESWVRLLLYGNLIDFTSRRMLDSADVALLGELDREELERALESSLAIDSTPHLWERLSGPPLEILWLTDNDGEAVLDFAFLELLVQRGHSVTVAARGGPAFNDATETDLRAVLEHPRFVTLREAMACGTFRVLSSGSRTVGTNLYHATPAFWNALRGADLVVAKGQGNWYTTRRLCQEVVYLLVSKGLTAERTTGVVAQERPPLDGMICALVPRDSSWNGTLRELSVE
ncbi:MAG: hypothetical protein KatS3mg115_1861 [Candidatus Poribacteria bacterium]|nr:MAG: hypothetical protein KatS3mg115_1861 [Candidatus Poribacteria bacterium]